MEGARDEILLLFENPNLTMSMFKAPLQRNQYRNNQHHYLHGTNNYPRKGLFVNYR